MNHSPADDGCRRPVRVAFEVNGREQERWLHFGNACTVGDLADVFGEGEGEGERDRSIVVDGIRHHGETPLRSIAIADGAFLGESGELHDGTACCLAVTGGLEAGSIRPASGDVISLGRGTGNDIVLGSRSVSRSHARLELVGGGASVVDLGSRNGTWVDSVLVESPTFVPTGRPVRLGATTVTVRPPLGAAPQPSPGEARRLVHRPPREVDPPDEPPLDAPRPERPPLSSSTFSWAMFLAPLLIGAVLAIVFTPVLALFALLSPVMLLANWYEQRHRSGRRKRRASRRFRADLERFTDDLRVRRARAEVRQRDACPDAIELITRAAEGSSTLWERRPHHNDFLRLCVGSADVPWAAPVSTPIGDDLDPDVELAVLTNATLRAVPVAVDLRETPVVGVVGPRAAREAVARHLVVQAAVLHGPADIGLGEIASAGGCERAWLAWAPHAEGASTASGPSATLLLADAEAVSARQFERNNPTAHHLVLASQRDELPASCSVLIEITDGHGGGRVAWLADSRVLEGVLLTGLGEPAARRAMRSLARFADPLAEDAGGLPDEVTLRDAFDFDVLDAAAVAAGWARSDFRALPAVLGAGQDGAVEVDLVASGPHLLIAGTTGSGKSELLRSIVLSLAFRCPPTDVTFLLIDYKGGSTFDPFDALPHTVGVVTDLDDHLGERALRSLEAELRRRERLFREAGASDLAAYRADRPAPAEALPRLVVLIDEFATMASELPGFVDSLIGIAQRGRSLGIHLVLATQRPAGAVSDLIRANTPLRIALRVADRHDSVDVIATDDAASIPNERPGRAFIRCGSGPLTAFQSAHTRARRDPPVAPPRLTPINDGPPSDQADPPAAVDDTEREVMELVSTLVAAANRSGLVPPRRPWLPPLPLALDLDELGRWVGGRSGEPDCDPPVTHRVLGIADDPDHQQQYPFVWPWGDGNLLIHGTKGSGASEALAAVALITATAHSPDDCHIYVVERHGLLQPLATLPHCGAVIRCDETARLRRLVRYLGEVVRARRAGSVPSPRILLLIDDIVSLVAEHDDLPGLRLVDELQRIMSDGSGVGVHVALSASRATGVSNTVLASSATRVALRMADTYDYAVLGLNVRPRADDLPKGRGFDAGGTEVQLAMPTVSELSHAVAEVARTHAPPCRPPMPIDELPSVVAVGSIAPGATFDGEPWMLPVGLGDTHLAPCGLVLHGGEHALVAGPPRSGRSTALATLASVVSLAGDGGVSVVALAARPSILTRVVPSGALVTDASALMTLVHSVEGRPVLVLIDDADSVPDDGTIAGLLTRTTPNLHIVAAGRADRLRGAYGHWTTQLRPSPTGLALRPDVDVDGDLWGVRFPRQVGLDRPGRGLVICDGEVEVVQVAVP